MQFPNYCQTRGDRLAHALWLVGRGGGFERADLARLIDDEFPEVTAEARTANHLPGRDAATVAAASAVHDALLQIQDREGRKLLPVIPWSWAEEIADVLSQKGLIRG